MLDGRECSDGAFVFLSSTVGFAQDPVYDSAGLTTESTQYHTALILLHRSFPTQPQFQQSNTARHSGSTHFSTLSRDVCVTNAVQVAEIMTAYKRRYALQRIFVTGLQHVGTAATALMAEISLLQGDRVGGERARLLEYLKGLGECMKEMSETYQPAVLMGSVVAHFIRDSGDAARADTGTQHTTAEQLTDPSLSKQSLTLIPSSAHATRASTLAPPELSSSFHTRGTATPTFGLQHASSSSLFDSRGGLPFLPSSWFDEMNWEEDNEFLNLMGLKDLQGLGGGAGGGLMEGFEMVDANEGSSTGRGPDGAPDVDLYDG